MSLTNSFAGRNLINLFQLAILLILIAYFFDYKSSKSTFAKDLSQGLLLCLGFLISAITFITVFDLHLIYGIMFVGIEMIIVFAIKAFIQSRNQ